MINTIKLVYLIIMKTLNIKFQYLLKIKVNLMISAKESII
jgi:hypothetical protein